MEHMIDDLFENDLSINLSNYSRLYDCIKQWLLTPDLLTMNEKSIQLNFYLNYFHYIRYGKVVRSNDDHNFTYEASTKPINNPSEFLLDYLAKFFTMDSSQLGFDTFVQ
ncbi:hypothetical protein I4U23_009033 [Adineta vaga]|nr:hypothetical protein I4U23_009033 [Adineta vaga]